VPEREAHVEVALRVVASGLEIGGRDPAQDDVTLSRSGRDGGQTTIHHERVEDLLAERVTRCR
jgi:hypothetical protein